MSCCTHVQFLCRFMSNRSNPLERIKRMKRNDQKNPQGNGYPQQNGFVSDAYPGGSPYQGYSAPGYRAPQGYPQQGYPQPQQGYPQPQQGYPGTRSYQTPQVTGSQPPVSSRETPPAYDEQGPYFQGGYPQQGVGPNQNGYPGTPYQQQTGYQQPNASGYGYGGGAPAGGSYIPQTPYNPGYTSPGYQAPNGYNQGYSPYSQMGRSQQTPYYPQRDIAGQVPLNGGGYVPQRPARRGAFVLTDAYLLIFSAVLLALFALGMFVPGLGILKWVFAVLAAGTIALLWIKPLVDNNKRLCYTIVFGLLILVTLIGFAAGGIGTSSPDTQRANPGPTGVSEPEQTDPIAAGALNPVAEPTPTVTNTPEPDQDSAATGRLQTFFSYWMVNNQDGMLTLCSPTWQSKQENPKTALFGLMGNRTPKEDIVMENISGTPNDTTRTVTITVLMDPNNGKDPVRYRIGVIMVKENDGLWYVDPNSIMSNDKADTPDPSITETPAPTETPSITVNTVLYYNPSGGEYYHLDQNCKRINERYLPLQGHFTYSELDKDAFKKLKPCAICGAPSRGQLGN